MRRRIEVLIVPDLHTRYEWIEELVSKVNPKLTIFLGDYFDQFRDTPEQNQYTAQWLRYSIHQTGRIHILGNHDIPYAHPGHPQAKCPGFTKLKCAAINQVMQPLDWAMCQMFVVHGQFIMSHAGIQASYLNPMMDLAQLGTWMADRAADYWDAVDRGQEHWFLNRGQSRDIRSHHSFGGLVWADFSELVPLPGWDQVVGHSPRERPRVLDKPGSSALCLDTLMPQDPYPRYCALVNSNGDLWTEKISTLLE